MTTSLRRVRIPAALALAAFAVIALATCQQAEPLEVTYYYLPG